MVSKGTQFGYTQSGLTLHRKATCQNDPLRRPRDSDDSDSFEGSGRLQRGYYVARPLAAQLNWPLAHSGSRTPDSDATYERSSATTFENKQRDVRSYRLMIMRQ